MTVAELIERLKQISPDDIVKVWDPDAEEWLPVTGYTWGGNDQEVRLYSDSDEEEETDAIKTKQTG